LVDKGYTLLPSVSASKDGSITFANSPTPTLIMLNGSCNVVSPTQELNTCERKVFYSPNSRSIQLNGEDTELIKYEIFDILGRQLASGRTESNANIAIDNQQSGIYFLKTAGKSACSQQVLRFLVN
jgi:Secretion system C-terminal sorting domain